MAATGLKAWWRIEANELRLTEERGSLNMGKCIKELCKHGASNTLAAICWMDAHILNIGPKMTIAYGAPHIRS